MTREGLSRWRNRSEKVVLILYFVPIVGLPAIAREFTGWSWASLSRLLFYLFILITIPAIGLLSAILVERLIFSRIETKLEKEVKS